MHRLSVRKAPLEGHWWLKIAGTAFQISRFFSWAFMNCDSSRWSLHKWYLRHSLAISLLSRSCRLLLCTHSLHLHQAHIIWTHTICIRRPIGAAVGATSGSTTWYLRFGRHAVQCNRLVPLVDSRFTRNRRMHYLWVAYYLWSYEEIGLLCSRSRSQQNIRMSVTVYPDGVFWNAEPYTTKLVTAMHHYEPNCLIQNVGLLSSRSRSQWKTMSPKMTS